MLKAMIELSAPGEGEILNRLKTIQRVRSVKGVVELQSTTANADIFPVMFFSKMSRDPPPHFTFLLLLLWQDDTNDRSLSMVGGPARWLSMLLEISVWFLLFQKLKLFLAVSAV